MGCGKTTVGRRLAPMLGAKFVDLDAYIEQREGRSVSEIFALSGEAAFRETEAVCCAELGAKRDLVIACGGGTVLRAENVRALRANGVIVWLQVSPQTVISRLQGDTSRPLLQRPDREEAVRSLLAQRESAYRAAADVTVPAEGKPFTVARRIRAALCR